MNRLSTNDRARVLACLVEGASIRIATDFPPEIQSSPLPNFRHAGAHAARKSAMNPEMKG